MYSTPTAAKPNPQANAGGGMRECPRSAVSLERHFKKMKQ